MDRMAWPARQGARRLVGAAQPRLIGDLEHLQHRLHRFLRLYAQHGSSTMSGLYQLIQVVGLVTLARSLRFGVFRPQPLRSAQTQFRVTRGLPVLF
jgi:hypothetical protein